MNEKVEKISDWGLLILAVANLILWIVAGNLGGILGWCGAVVTVFIYLTCKAGLKAKIDDLLDGVEIQNLQDEVDFYKRRADEAIRIAEDVREIARKSLDHASDVNANNKLYNEDARAPVTSSGRTGRRGPGTCTYAGTGDRRKNHQTGSRNISRLITFLLHTKLFRIWIESLL